jgi:hypothetical protein
MTNKSTIQCLFYETPVIDKFIINMIHFDVRGLKRRNIFVKINEFDNRRPADQIKAKVKPHLKECHTSDPKKLNKTLKILAKIHIRGIFQVIVPL